MKKSFFGAVLICLVSGGVLLAQDSPAPSAAPSPVPTSVLSATQQRVLDLVKLDLAMAQALNKVAANRDRLVVLYEKLVEIQCMPQLAERLEYSGNPQDPACLEYLKALTDVDPANLVAACAKYGIDSEPCKAAYDNQYIGTYDTEKPGVEQMDLEAKLAVLDNEQSLFDMSRDLDRARAKFKTSKAAEDRKEIGRLLSRILPVACKTIRIRIQHQQPPDQFKASQVVRNPAFARDPLNQLVDAWKENSAKDKENNTRHDWKKEREDASLADPLENKHAKPQKTPVIPAFWRVRYLTAECLDYIRQVLDYDKDFAAAVCYHDGFSAPNCIAARRRQREKTRKEAKHPGKGAAQGTPQSGLGTF